MVADQIKLLTSLAKEIEAKEINKKIALASLQSAKILDKSGNFTKHYSHLGRLIVKK